MVPFPAYTQNKNCLGLIFIWVLAASLWHEVFPKCYHPKEIRSPKRDSGKALYLQKLKILFAILNILILTKLASKFHKNILIISTQKEQELNDGQTVSLKTS